MSKHAKRKSKKKKQRTASWPTGGPPPPWEAELDQVNALYEEGEIGEAFALLETLLSRYPNAFKPWAQASALYYQQGQIIDAVTAARQAGQIKTAPPSWAYILGEFYAEAGFYEHAYQTLQKAFRQGIEIPTPKAKAELHNLVAELEEKLQDLARTLEKPLNQVHKGKYFHEEAQITLHQENYKRAISLYRKAIRLLGEKCFAAYNGLSLALYAAGFPRKAIDTLEQALQKHPNNQILLASMVFLQKHIGDDEEAAKNWEQVKRMGAPTSTETWEQVLKAALAMDDDQTVYNLLQKPPTPEAQEASQDWPGVLYHAIAEANLGKPRSAIRRLRPWTDLRSQQILEALKAGRKSFGLSGRFTYLTSADLVPDRGLEAIAALEMADISEKQRARKGKEILQHYPQVLAALKRLIWDENGLKLAIHIANLLAQPEAYAVLEEFALGQEGSDSDRLQTLIALQAAGYFPPGKRIRFWRGDKWTEVEGITTAVVEEEEKFPYSPTTIALLDQAHTLANEGKTQQAKKILEQVVAETPNVREAYNDLAALASQENDFAQAKAWLQKALEVDPDYAMAAINLAQLALFEDQDIETAHHLLNRVLRRGKIAPHDMARLAYLQAYIALQRDDLAAAWSQINIALTLAPGDPMYEQMLRHIEMLEATKQIVAEARQYQQKKRARRRQKINTIDPSLEQALSLLTRDELLNIARATGIPRAYKFRKAELLEKVIERLQSPQTLTALVTQQLSDQQREALQYVLEIGSAAPLEDFREHFASDSDEQRATNIIEDTLLNPLENLGLLVETQLDDQPFVCIPMELRPLLKQALAKAAQ